MLGNFVTGVQGQGCMLPEESNPRTDLNLMANHVCRFCGLRLQRLSDLQIHLTTCTHNSDGSNQCEICKRMFITKNDLQIHNIHCRSKVHKCLTCNMTFMTKQKLRRHSSTHSDKRPYKCEICPADYKYLCGLRIHVRAHKSEEPYECVKCQKKFTLPTPFHEHLQVHSGKLLECTICKETFREKKTLKRHYNSEHRGVLP